MTENELIAKAKEHARLFIDELPVDTKVIDGACIVREAVIIYFGKNYNSRLKVFLDKKTGDLIGAELAEEKGSD